MMREDLGGVLALCLLAAAQSLFGNTQIPLASGMTYESSLPVVYIDFPGKASAITKDAYIDARMRILGNEKYGGTGACLYDGPISIKGRGNTTWHLPKKPYKIKLDKKANLFGFGKNKHWVLLANYQDECLMRNKIAYDLSNELGLVQMESTWVDVVLNGEYIGNYQLCEHIRIGSSRIDIFNWDDVIGDADETNLGWLTDDPTRNITGGYLFELSHEYDEITKFKTDSGLKVMVKEPEYLKTNKEMLSYVRDFWQSLEEAWLSPDKHNEAGISWKEYADVDSMVAYWLVQEIMGNRDAVYKSRHAYKDVDAPIVFGPVWDFDWSSASAMVDASSTGWKVTLGHRVDNVFKYWLADAEFRSKAVVAYARLKDYLNDMVASGGLLDYYRSYILASACQNEARWFFKRGFEADFAEFQHFLSSRIWWLDSVLDSEYSLERSVSPLYGTALSPSGSFTGARNVEYVGKVLQCGRLVGTIKLKAGKARSSALSRVTGQFVGPDGRTNSIKGKKIPVGDSPALAVMSTKVSGESNTLAIRISDQSFVGMLGAYGVEGTSAKDRLPNGKYVFRMAPFARTVGEYQISLDELPLEKNVTIKGAKWKVENDSTSGSASTLKLTGSVRGGVFSGKFKVHAAKGRRKKTFTASINGVISNGEARGVATIKSLGVSCEVSLQLAE